MSAVPTTTPAPARTSKVASPLRWIASGGATAAVLAALAIAVWPASEADRARDDGERFGAAVAQLQAADTPEEVDAALTELGDAAIDTRDHGYDAVSSQVSDQAHALNRAADGYVGSITTDDAFEADLYEAELDGAVSDLENNADDFRTTGPDVQQAFWDGYETGVNGG
jgi:ABC-type sugar transport system substrate-binding protein